MTHEEEGKCTCHSKPLLDELLKDETINAKLCYYDSFVLVYRSAVKNSLCLVVCGIVNSFVHLYWGKSPGEILLMFVY